MVIASSRLARYAATLQFPVDILQERGPRVDRVCKNKAELFQLIKLGVVIGIGSSHRIKHLRINRPTEAVMGLRLKLRARLGAEDNKTTHQVSRTQSHHAGRSAAYRTGLTPEQAAKKIAFQRSTTVEKAYDLLVEGKVSIRLDGDFL